MSGSRAALAAAVAAGYVLGRTRKTKLALAVGTCLAGRGLGACRGRVPAEGPGGPGTSRIQDIADQLRDELLASGHAAVLAADRWLTGVADALHDRTGPHAAHRYDEQRDDHDDWADYEDDHVSEDDYADEDDYAGEDDYADEDDYRVEDDHVDEDDHADEGDWADEDAWTDEGDEEDASHADEDGHYEDVFQEDDPGGTDDDAYDDASGHDRAPRRR